MARREHGGSPLKTGGWSGDTLACTGRVLVVQCIGEVWARTDPNHRGAEDKYAVGSEV